MVGGEGVEGGKKKKYDIEEEVRSRRRARAATSKAGS